MNVITPFDNENYCDYIKRLKIERPLGINNKPKNFYTEGHHILPKCLNGDDDSTNIIIILPEEHYYCHKLLALENPEIESLQFAWWRMCHKVNGDAKREYDVSPEEYAEAKKRIALNTQKMNSVPVVEIISGIVYSSAEEAARVLNIKRPTNITSCCKGRSKSANGYKFCYLSDYLVGNYENKTVGQCKRVIDLDTKEIYESSIEAAEILKIRAISIRQVCHGTRKTTGGHRFAYYDDYLKGEYTIKPFGHEGKPVQDINSGIIYNSIAEAANKLNLDASSISKVCRGKVQSTKGYKFIYYNSN